MDVVIDRDSTRSGMRHQRSGDRSCPFIEDVMRGDEAMGYKPPEPVWDMNDVVVPFLLVHGGHDLTKFHSYR